MSTGKPLAFSTPPMAVRSHQGIVRIVRMTLRAVCARTLFLGRGINAALAAVTLSAVVQITHRFNMVRVNAAPMRTRTTAPAFCWLVAVMIRSQSIGYQTPKVFVGKPMRHDANSAIDKSSVSPSGDFSDPFPASVRQNADVTHESRQYGFVRGLTARAANSVFGFMWRVIASAHIALYDGSSHLILLESVVRAAQRFNATLARFYFPTLSTEGAF